MEKIKRRYPGAQPFEEEDTFSLFGRTQELHILLQSLRLENTVVLHAKTGTGKTSLINALLATAADKLPPVTIRFRANIAKTQLQQQFFDAIRESRPASSPSWFETLVTNLKLPNDSLWAQMKRIELTLPENTSFLFVFDQFEELLAFFKDEVSKFSHELSTVLGRNMPTSHLETLIDLGLGLGDRDMKLVTRPVRARALFSLRSESLYLLENLADDFPDIFRNLVMIGPLSKNAAMEALLEPARIQGDYVSGTFFYAPEAANAIIDAASDGQDSVEPLQLQFLAQQAEEIVLRSPGKKIVELNDLDDLSRFWTDLYKREILRLDQTEMYQARRILEEELVSNNQRVLVNESVLIKKFGPNTPPLLNKLKDRRLVTKSLFATGVYWGLAHDRLITPLTEALIERRKDETVRISFVRKLLGQEGKTYKIIFVASIIIAVIFAILIFLSYIQ